MPHSRLFDRLTGEQVEMLLSRADKLHFHRNSIAINQGHPADYFYLLVRGRGRFFFVTDEGEKNILRWIVPGDVFGLGAITTEPSAYLVGVELTHDSNVLVWSRAKIRTLAALIPQLVENAISLCQDYLDWYVTAHETLTSHSAGKRLAILLIRLSSSIGVPVADGIQLDVRNDELANAANTTVFTVSRWLNKWQRCKALAKGRNKLVLQSKDLLLQNADLDDVGASLT